MTTPRPPDEHIAGWLRSGPETAPASLVESTLRPIPRMRQRRSWRITLGRVLGPIRTPAAVVAGLIVVIVGLAIVAGLPRAGGVAAPSGPSRPTFQLRLARPVGAATWLGAGPYEADPTTSLNLCTRATEGSWRFLYGGGDPYVNIDLLVDGRAGSPDGAHRVAAEIYAGAEYLRFDPAVLRGGDPPGRSQASVTVTEGATATRFAITATTPDRSTSVDGQPITVELTVTCPHPP
jgi:hypothetical protein